MRHGIEDDFVDERDIARRLRVPTTTVARWRAQEADFPQPISPQLLGTAWHWSEIEAWAKATGRWREDLQTDRRGRWLPS